MKAPSLRSPAVEPKPCRPVNNDSQAVGNMCRFQANPNSPVYAEFVSLTLKTLGTVPVLREALQALLSALQSAWVYGSVAKQRDTAQSDVDVMLVGKGLQLSQVLALAS